MFRLNTLNLEIIETFFDNSIYIPIIDEYWHIKIFLKNH